MRFSHRLHEGSALKIFRILPMSLSQGTSNSS